MLLLKTFMSVSPKVLNYLKRIRSLWKSLPQLETVRISLPLTQRNALRKCTFNPANYSLRRNRDFALPLCKTNRRKNSFIFSHVFSA